ncbi:MAG: hypothetical protein WC787_04195 [Patescibacteria group bacterium]|jgi:hypothetical protein
MSTLFMTFFSFRKAMVVMLIGIGFVVFGNSVFAASDLHAVTTNGNTTTNSIQFGGGTSTGLFTTDAFVVSGAQSFLTGINFVAATGSIITTTNLAFTSASGSSLTIGGVSVCLSNGTNCPTGSGPVFTEDATNNTIFPVTMTRDVLFGGNTSATANFVFDTALTGGKLGVNIPTPTEALDVSGNIQNILHTGDTLRQIATTTFNSDAMPNGLFVSGKYAYVTNYGNNTLAIVDVSNPIAPDQVSTTTFPAGTGPSSVFVSGKYAYVTHFDADSMAVLDVSNPAVPLQVATTTFAGDACSCSVFVSGKYAYVTAFDSGRFLTVDVSNPMAPVQTATTSFNGGSGAQSISVSGRYAYVVNHNSAGGRSMAVLDLSNPAVPLQVATTTFALNPGYIVVSGRYAYVTSYNDILATVDISNPTSPVQVATTTFPAGTGPVSISVSGRYAYVAGYGGSTLNVLDISNPASPVQVATTTFPGPGVNVVVVSGRYAYLTNFENSTLVTVDIQGAEVNGLIAHSAELGNLQVLNDGAVANHFTIGGSLTVGNGGIFSQGSLGITGISTFLGTVTVQGQPVCLANGTNCPSGMSLDFQTVTTNGNTTTNSIQFGGGTSTGLFTTDALTARNLNVLASTTNVTMTFISNTADNAVPVLDVRGGCSDANGTADIFLAGNTTDSRKFSVRCNGNVYADGVFLSLGGDYAEYFLKNTTSTFAAGDVVAFDSSRATSRVVRANATHRNTILGVVSTKPGFLGNAEEGRETDPAFVAVALKGQVPTVVSASNGSISAGDLLMAGDNGMAVKARGPGLVLGTSMGTLSSGTGTIMVYVAPQWSGDMMMRSGFAKMYAGATEVNVTFPTINAYPVVSVTPRGDVGNYYTDDWSDTGFTILLKEPLNFDAVFSWFVTPSEVGSVMHFSDNASAP